MIPSPLMELKNLLTPERLIIGARVIIIVLISFASLKLILASLKKVVKKRLSEQTAMLINKGVYYSGLIIIIIMIFNQLGFKLTALLGAAGIAGIAIGFAAQTSVSNIISGLFLISENTFTVGDLIQVGNTLGYVMQIDLLSIKIRTFDNRYVRLPNETLVKTEVTNVTRFPIRRLDLNIGVAYREDIERVRDVLFEIASTNKLCLDDPSPFFLFKGFGESSLDIMFGVWCITDDYLNLKNSIMINIKKRFDLEKIEIPFPHVSVYTGSVTDPFPVKVENRK